VKWPEHVFSAVSLTLFLVVEKIICMKLLGLTAVLTDSIVKRSYKIPAEWPDRGLDQSPGNAKYANAIRTNFPENDWHTCVRKDGTINYWAG